MGLKLLSEDSSDINPNPYRFIIRQSIIIGDYVILQVSYPGCTNFEGNKILVYHNVNRYVLYRQTTLDPHFSENENRPSPIARFRPDKEGLDNAIRFCQAMKDK